MAPAEPKGDATSFAVNSYATALCLVPPESCWPPVDRLRSLYDKAYRKWPPHVNLVYPFVRPESLDAAAQRILSIFEDGGNNQTAQASIDVCLETAGVFSHRHEKTLFLHDGREDGSADALRNLRAGILAALEGRSSKEAQGKVQQEDQSKDKDTFRMHMTIAQSSDAASHPTDADDTLATPNDTLGHAYRFLLHKVELMPPVEWQADRLHILVRERLTTRGRDGEVVATSSRMRLWGVLSLTERTLEKLSQTEPFYEQLPFDDNRGATEGIFEEEDGEKSAKDGDELESFNALTFVPEDDEWIRCSEDLDLYDSHILATASSLCISTYNVLGEFEWPPSTDRFPQLIKNVLAGNAAADVLVLQEVTDDFLSALLADDGVRAAYPFVSHGPPDQDDMEPLPSLLNTVVLSRCAFSWSWLAFHRAHKGALIARFRGSNDNDGTDVEEGDERYSLVLSAVHLTHGLTNGSVTAKRAELLRLLGHLRRRYPSSAADSVVIAGDLNIHTSSFAIDAAVQRKAISIQTAQYVKTGFDNLFSANGFADAWQATQGLDEEENDRKEHNRQHDYNHYDGEEGATYNPFTNALAAQIIGSGLNNRPQRFDRILVRHPAETNMGSNDSNEQRYKSHFKIARFDDFGFPAADQDLSSPTAFASDHWGIRCVLERVEEPYETEDEGDLSLPDELTKSVPAESAKKAEDAAISPEIAKLVVPVVPTKAPVGPLADAGSVSAALQHLGVLPSDDEVLRRKEAFNILKAILLDDQLSEPTPAESEAPSKKIRQLVVVPVGSYGLDVWTPASDIDCLCIGTFASHTFFALTSQRLRAAAAKLSRNTTAVKIIRRVRASTGTMLELEVNGFRIDLQYCQAGMIAETWPAALVLPPTHPVFALSPQTLSKLKAARDLYYLRKSFPEALSDSDSCKADNLCIASNFRAAHRAIKTWARARGLYAARFGYLSGIQIAILLARVMKLMQMRVDETAEGKVGDKDSQSSRSFSVSDILVTFFRHYAGFDWKTKMAFDPFFHSQKVPYTPTAREPLAILGYHRPQLNTSSAASVPSVRVLAEELQRADRLLRDEGDHITWDEFLSGGGRGGAAPAALPGLAPGPAEFVQAYRTYVKIDLQYWGLSLNRGSAFVGWLESRCVLLLVDLARRLPELNARIWPGRFVDGTEDAAAAAAQNAEEHGGEEEESRQYQGCYLIGLDLPASLSREARQIALGTLQSVLAHFEKQLKRGGDGHDSLRNYDPQWQWISVSIANRADLGDVGRLQLDSRAWGEYTPGDEEEDEDEDEDDEGKVDKEGEVDKTDAEGENVDGDDSDSRAARSKGKKGKSKPTTRHPFTVVHRPGNAKFRTAQDVIKRLRWDPHLDRSDFIVGYEDRFAGAQERALELWKSEQTDEEFIPQHRIIYFRRRSDGAIVWDRRTRKDDVFGSGV